MDLLKGIIQLRCPTVDHFEPEVAHLEEAVKFISGTEMNCNVRLWDIGWARENGVNA